MVGGSETSQLSLEKGDGRAVRQKSCDRCYRIKERCTFGLDNVECSRCCRLGYRCSSDRKAKRNGRPPTLNSFGYGSMLVSAVEPGALLVAPSRTKRSNDRRIDKLSSATSSSPSVTSFKSSQQVSVLSQRSSMALGSSSKLCSEPAFPPLWLLDLTAKDFTMTHGWFTIGPTFLQSFHMAVRWVLASSPLDRLEGYAAFVFAMHNVESWSTSQNETGILLGARGLQSLRNSEFMIARDMDAALMLGVGLALVIVDGLASCHASRIILRSSLLPVRPLIRSLLSKPALDPITIPPLLIDTVQCLLTRQVPCIRLPASPRVIVDRCCGLCPSLLPVLYDLCERSELAKTQSLGSDEEPSVNLYFDLEDFLHCWNPPWPPELISRYTAEEVSTMMTQAEVYRLGALLVIHRLRYPIGVQDYIGQGYANRIFSEITSYLSSAVERNRFLPMVFPLLVAMVEIAGPGERILTEISHCHMQRVQTFAILNLVTHIRSKMAEGHCKSWLDFVAEDMVPCLI